ncbi:MAG TPA: hypothetical protein VGO93_21500, partial [Candidatus Xenobia bacterium]
AAGVLGNRALGYHVVQVNVDVQDRTVRQGDVLVIRRPAPEERLHAGLVVTYDRFATYSIYHVRGDQIATIWAAAGDAVEWQHDKQRFLINGRVIDAPPNIRAAWHDHPDMFLDLAADRVFLFPTLGQTDLDHMLLPTSAVDGVVKRIQDPPDRRKDLST